MACIRQRQWFAERVGGGVEQDDSIGRHLGAVLEAHFAASHHEVTVARGRDSHPRTRIRQVGNDLPLE